MSQRFISFPEGILHERPLRLPLLFDSEACFALVKPAGIPATRDALGSTGGGVTLLDALRRDAELGKGQLKRLGIGPVHAVTFPDPEVAGIFLCAKSEDAKATLKNAMGGSGFGFGYRFLASGRVEEDERRCDLPLTHPAGSKRMLVSHTNGKRTITHFRRERVLGAYTLWEAESAYNRRHQVLLHAMESGLPVVGDRLYARSSPLYLSQLKRNYRAKGREEALYDHPCAVMTRLRFPDPESGRSIEVCAPEPSRFRAMLAQIERYGRG